MYLTDVQIRKKLGEMDFKCSNPEEPILPDEVIQPCSIDLRLDNVFWQPKKTKSIDLRKSRLMELSPFRNWRKTVLSKGECIALEPGQLICGRVYEELKIPTDCAGKIQGRSSFARIGLGVRLSHDFVNPGYRGHMPLQLVNYSPNRIILYPYLPICQLILVMLSEPPSRLYGDSDLQSKYMDDDGSPSYWWRDSRIRKLQDAFIKKDVALRLQEEIIGNIGVQDPEVIERFEQFVSGNWKQEILNAEHLLELFLREEERLRRRDRFRNAIGRSLFPILGSTSLAILFVRPIGPLHVVIWAGTVISLELFRRSFGQEPKEYLSAEFLRKSD